MKEDGNKQDPTDSKMMSGTRKARRKILRGAAAGGGVAAGLHALPEKWASPVVDSVVLPAHAATSPEGLRDPCETQIIPIDTETFDILVIGVVLGQGDLGGIQMDIVANNGGDDRLDSTTTDQNGEYQLQMGPFDACEGANVQVTVTSPDPRLAGQEANCTAESGKSCVQPE